MSLFGAIVRTAVNVVKLPVSLPVAIVKDTLDTVTGNPTNRATVAVVEEIKNEAEAKD